MDVILFSFLILAIYIDANISAQPPFGGYRQNHPMNGHFRGRKGIIVELAGKSDWTSVSASAARYFLWEWRFHRDVPGHGGSSVSRSNARSHGELLSHIHGRAIQVRTKTLLKTEVAKHTEIKQWFFEVTVAISIINQGHDPPYLKWGLCEKLGSISLTRE
ncbi:hypothetical protein Y5S_02583 [Alcanivorax nanhaiticus]|uniref:Uncharacterized protein n=1 Tax=Alcanivorax nanhaiticus TaxID=1177154 RepID=A0A095SI10_9GAMM|nr:hypothetical protein [Alcanivorax nanhaiticus]KGD64281.1 hypothetical protein Y5S_02583 [Alcanivorax nanhaiticus]